VRKFQTTAFSAVVLFGVSLACSVALPLVRGAQSAQSANDPNRPPYAQNPRRAAAPAPPPAQPSVQQPSVRPASLKTAEKYSLSGPSGDEKILFDHVNEARVLTGLPALRWDTNLAAAARKHCSLLVQHEELSHQFPGEEGVKERARHAGAEFSVVAENVAVAGSPDEIHYEWMHSPPHRANILDAELTAIGIAEMPGNKGLYAVQDFSLAVEKLSLAEQEEKIRALISAAGVRTADNPERTQWSDARKTCQMTGSFVGSAGVFLKFDSADLSQLPPRLKTLLATGKYRSAAVGACDPGNDPDGFTHYKIAVLLY
jgi:uncharacterized protein YkwD